MIDRNIDFLKTVSGRDEYKNIVLDSLNSSADLNSYIFRRGNHWYRLENWDLPFSGIIREWKANGDDCIPKDKCSDSFDIKNSKIILDINKLNNQYVLGDIRQITFTDDANIIMAIFLREHIYNVVLLNKKDLRIINMIKDISVETLPYLTNNSVLYCRNDEFGRPSKLYYKLLQSEKEFLIYQEEEISYRLKIIPSRGIEEVCLVKSANFQQGKLFVYDERYNEINFNILYNQYDKKNLPNHYNLIKINDEIYFITSFRSKSSTGICFKKIGSFEETQYEIRSKIIIKSIDTFGCNILLKTSSESSYLLLKHQISKKLDFKEIEINFNNAVNIYENSNSNKNILFLENTIFLENVMNFDISKETLKLEFSKNLLKGNNYDYKYKLIWATCDKNRVKIPISLLWKGEEDIPQKKRCILYVYGAYGKDDSIKIDPIVSSIINSNFLYAVVHVRGGGFLGGEWYRSGKELNKKNSITDFVSGVNYLIKNGFVDSNSLGLISSSAGAIVAGATFNDNPNLFKGILLFSPFIDPYGALLSKNDPLSKTEIAEWGDICDRRIRKYIRDYSPMQNIEKVKSSNSTIISLLGKNDKYIDNSSVVEWSNRLHTKNINSLVYINENAGHGGISHNDKELFAIIMSYFLSIVNR